MKFHMYISLQDADRIVRFAMDSDTGKLERQGETRSLGGPAPLAVNPTRTTLYVGNRREYSLSSFAIDKATGDLTPTGDVELGGEPNYLSTDRKGRYLLSSYYQAGHVAVHPIDETGAVGGEAIEWIFTNYGAHSIQTDPSNKYAFLPHVARFGPALLPEGSKPINAIFQYKFDENTGHLTPNDPPRISPKTPDGPRHYRFHPSKDLMYVLNEQASSVTVYALDTSTGTLTAGQTVSTLPEGFKERSHTSQIQIHPSGRHLYAINRGYPSIASFAIDETTGALTPTGRTKIDAGPRAFSLDPTGHFLYAPSQLTPYMLSFRIDQQSGALTSLETTRVGTRLRHFAMWVLITDPAE